MSIDKILTLVRIPHPTVFSQVRSGECILIPGNVVVIERVVQTGHLTKYMTDNYEWIAKAFAGKSVHGQGRDHVIENIFHQVPVRPKVCRTRYSNC
jgi:hypothetical protein